MTDHTQTVVLGLGSPLMADDGLGLVVLDQLRRWRFTPPVELVDGGTWGMNLLHIIEDADRLLLVDAIDVRTAPGSLVELWNEQIPRHLSHKVSPHQIDLREVLAVAELRGHLPPEMVAIGLQPAVVEMQATLSDTVFHRLPVLGARARDILRAWGHASTPGAVLTHA